MKLARILTAVLAAETFLLAFGSSADPAQIKQGKDLFARRCSGCHSPDADKEGPRLRGVFGRRSATVPGFGYSDALKKLNVQWDEATLDRWLTDPDAMAPDTDMTFHLSSAEERRAIIAYLKGLSHE